MQSRLRELVAVLRLQIPLHVCHEFPQAGCQVRSPVNSQHQPSAQLGAAQHNTGRFHDQC